MSSTPEEIATFWGEQMLKGYLKLAVLLVLIREPLHGYQIMKHIHELTMGVITPTAGGIYPTLRELELKGLIRGEWRAGERRKVYEITERGREVFREAMKKHFELGSSFRRWILKALADLKIIEEVEMPEALAPAARILFLDEDAPTKDRIEALERLRTRLRNLAILINAMARHIDNRIEELRSDRIERSTTA
ncbi:MAG: helix-turn-helix transcriptional regulator [Candidatus Bathyarchaeia archaeon]